MLELGGVHQPCHVGSMGAWLSVPGYVGVEVGC